MKHLIIGEGEIGNGLYKVLRKGCDVKTRDVDGEHVKNSFFDVLHVCFPYSDRFVESVKEYIKEYHPKIVLIHSTVPVGTTRECGSRCIHSPVRGKHPDLDKGIMKFTKYFGGTDEELVYEAMKIFQKLGVMCKNCNKPENTELLKIMSTTYYGWLIVFQKEVKRLCDEMDCDFDLVYEDSNRTYNYGYYDLGMLRFRRPILQDVPGPIGGHCVVQNCDLLKDFVTDVIKNKNKDYEENSVL